MVNQGCSPRAYKTPEPARKGLAVRGQGSCKSVGNRDCNDAWPALDIHREASYCSPMGVFVFSSGQIQTHLNLTVASPPRDLVLRAGSSNDRFFKLNYTTLNRRPNCYAIGPSSRICLDPTFWVGSSWAGSLNLNITPHGRLVCAANRPSQLILFFHTINVG